MQAVRRRPLAAVAVVAVAFLGAGPAVFGISYLVLVWLLSMFPKIEVAG